MTACRRLCTQLKCFTVLSVCYFPLKLAPACALSTRVLLKQCGSLKNWKSGLRTCVHTDTVIFVKRVSHRQWLSLCVSHFSDRVCVSLMMTFKGIFHHKPKHQHMHVDQREWLSTPSRNCKAKREVANLTSRSVFPYLELSLFSLSRTSLSPRVSLHASLYSRFTALEPFLSHSLSPFPSPVLCHSSSLAPLSHSTPCHSPPPSLFFFSSSGDGDWQMIWQRKTSGEKKLTSPYHQHPLPLLLLLLPPLEWTSLFLFKVCDFSLHSSALHTPVAFLLGGPSACCWFVLLSLSTRLGSG